LAFASAEEEGRRKRGVHGTKRAEEKKRKRSGRRRMNLIKKKNHSISKGLEKEG